MAAQIVMRRDACIGLVGEAVSEGAEEFHLFDVLFWFGEHGSRCSAQSQLLWSAHILLCVYHLHGE